MLFNTHNPLNLPKHIAIIMDGNARWAKAKNLSTLSGHKKGGQVGKEIIIAAKNLGIQYLTLYAFSTENWSRPASWVNDLMGLLHYYLKNEVRHFVKEKIRIKFLGDLTKLNPDIQKLALQCEKDTESFTGFQLNIALNYGGRNDMTRAMQKIGEKIKNGLISPDAINEALIEDHLDTAGIPDPDLLIRTSGEMRISNYLLWQMAYTEFIFTKTLWPDYTVDEFLIAMNEFIHRDRRFGNNCAAV